MTHQWMIPPPLLSVALLHCTYGTAPGPVEASLHGVATQVATAAMEARAGEQEATSPPHPSAALSPASSGTGLDDVAKGGGNELIGMFTQAILVRNIPKCHQNNITQSLPHSHLLHWLGKCFDPAHALRDLKYMQQYRCCTTRGHFLCVTRACMNA